MKHGLKKRILSLVLCISMVLPMAAVPMPVYSVENEESIAPLSNPFTPETIITLPDGTTTSSQSYRIPSMVTLADGTIVAAADIRWNTTYDGGCLDTLVARSTDGGATWSYTVANYLGDNGNTYNSQSTAFIDSCLTVAEDGKTVYLLCDLYPYGIALNGNGSQTTPATDVGFTEEGYLKLSSNDHSSYDFYLKDGCIYNSSNVQVAGYRVDEYFNLFNENNEKVSNLFFADSPYKVVRTGFLYLTSSTDGGANWSAPTLLDLKNDTENVCLASPGRGITTANGTMIFPVYSYSTQTQKLGFLFSTDSGATWERSEDFDSIWASESAVVEIGEGTLRFFFRNQQSALCYVDYNMDANAWSGYINTGVKINSNTQLSAITYSKTFNGSQVVLVSCPTGPNEAGSADSDGSYRSNGKIFMGVVAADGSMSWPKSIPVSTTTATAQLSSPYTEEKGFFAYSCLTERADGSIAILYENNQYGWGSDANTFFTINAKAYAADTFGIAFDSDDKKVTLEKDGITVTGKIPKGITLSVQPVEINRENFGIEENSQIFASLDIKLLESDNTEWQPQENEYLTITLEAQSLGMIDGDEFTIYHQHSGQVAVSDVYTVEDGLLTFRSDGFSIYVVVGTYANDWNYNNHKIVMTVGDSLQVSTSTRGNSYSWSITGGSAHSFTLTSENDRQATIRSTAAGTVTLQCQISNRYSSTTESLQVVALPSVGNSVDDDIIFANIDKAYSSGDTEYENTYGPYVMKIRFEDTNGNVLKYTDGTTVGEDYYVFDSDTNIDVNTFAASAPDGYTYAGAFFYWGGHFGGDKVYVTNVERVNSNTATGSHLYYSGTHNTSGVGRWTYQASGVLHAVYAPIEDVHAVIFKDHCGYELANYALPHNDGGVTFPSGYIGNIDNMANTLITNHHAAHDPGYGFNNSWIVTGGGLRIDGTYTTAELKSAITRWNITSNITITAQCSEPEITINYVVVGPEGSGSVTPTSETVKVISGNTNGSVATANSGYQFAGWFQDEACTLPVDPSWITSGNHLVPQKEDGSYQEATYYAKFESAVTSLTISKTGSVNIDENQSFLFRVEGEGVDLTVTVHGNGSATINGLKVGSQYTVTELTDWSWRYDFSEWVFVSDDAAGANGTENAAAVTLGTDGNQITFTNTRSENKWLDGDSWRDNLFNGN